MKHQSNLNCNDDYCDSQPDMEKRKKHGGSGRIKKGLLSHMNSMEATERREHCSLGSMLAADGGVNGLGAGSDSGVEISSGSFVALKVPALNMDNLARTNQVVKVNSDGGHGKMRT